MHSDNLYKNLYYIYMYISVKYLFQHYKINLCDLPRLLGIVEPLNRHVKHSIKTSFVNENRNYAYQIWYPLIFYKWTLLGQKRYRVLHDALVGESPYGMPRLDTSFDFCDDFLLP